MPPPPYDAALVAEVASRLHDQSRRLPAGAARMKDDGAGSAVDIANTAYGDLPQLWQEENLAAAAGVLAALQRSRDVEALAEVVHNQWVDRNRAWAPPAQLLPYGQLSEADRDKDRAVVHVALAVLSARP